MKFDCFASGVALHLSLAIACASAHAQNVVRIEEDWTLQVVEPDQQLDSPQITTAMLPLGPNSSTVFSLDINHGSAPNYSAGGLQLRIDQNGEASNTKRLSAGDKLSHASETIKWTQVAIQQGTKSSLASSPVRARRGRALVVQKPSSIPLPVLAASMPIATPIHSATREPCMQATV